MSLVLIRLLALKEPASLVLVLDSLLQSAHHLLREFVFHAPGAVVYLSFETATAPDYATTFLDCSRTPHAEIAAFVAANVPSKKALVIVDSLNYTGAECVAQLVSAIVRPNATVVACYHTDAPVPFSHGHPLLLAVLLHVAQAVFEVSPASDPDEELVRAGRGLLFAPSAAVHRPVFKAHLTYRRKLGKALLYVYKMDTVLHEHCELRERADDAEPADNVLAELTTFNLNTNAKQRSAREKIDMPFMEAQTEIGKMGGAIVYEYEKDDDYDEEDPYEGPF
ncbi:hypothetical protein METBISCDRAFT_17834 [Metschnikowia bicuspidata]|uniref:Elongator complex protein 5 n=1 Tax=Metschnikowia bicuspidata TaxID=27322 RepID=A0A4P9ZAD4_9ASCO|nr:hypothetical protein METBISCDRAFT_17834 [Metschnikowia bicuspidata]